MTSKLVALRLLAESAGVVRQALLDVGLGLQAHLHQALDVLLGLRTLHRGQERVPFGADLGVRRQARDVDQALDVGDGPLVEPGDAPGQRVHEVVQLGVGHRAVDVAIALRQVAGDVLAAEQNFQRAAAPDQAWQAGHRSAAGYQRRTYLPLRQNCLLCACETHVTRERQLAADAGCATSNRNYRYDRCSTKTHQHVGQWRQPGWSRGEVRRIRQWRNKVVVRQEESGHRAVEHDHLYLRVSFQLSDRLAQLRNGLRPENVERWNVECDAPVRWREALYMHLLPWRCAVRR